MADVCLQNKDFSNKTGISYKESRETHYWLRILEQLYSEPVYQKDFQFFKKEAQELKNIFAGIKKSSRDNPN